MALQDNRVVSLLRLGDNSVSELPHRLPSEASLTVCKNNCSRGFTPIILPSLSGGAIATKVCVRCTFVRCPRLSPVFVTNVSAEARSQQPVGPHLSSSVNASCRCVIAALFDFTNPCWGYYLPYPSPWLHVHRLAQLIRWRHSHKKICLMRIHLLSLSLPSRGHQRRRSGALPTTCGTASVIVCQYKLPLCCCNFL